MKLPAPARRPAPIPTLLIRAATPTPALRDAVDSAVLARVLAARGVVDPAQLQLDLERLIDPALLDGAADAAELLEEILRAGAGICVVGDYDADGATSTTLAVHGLRAFGAARVDFLVPDRVRDGYGLSEALADRAAATGARCLLTVDNGTSSIAGVARARALGMTVIVTDHHLPGAELPAADAIVNPNLPGAQFPSRSLAGVGVMFYLLLALRTRLRANDWFQARPLPNLADYLDLVALGTIADVVPLDTNNRILVHQGLQRIRAGRARPGIAALLAIARRDAEHLDEIDVGFAVAPRLNAAGRLADMTVGVRCLLSDSAAEAARLAAALDAINADRRTLSRDMIDHALTLLDDALLASPFGVCLFDATWHEGIVGIVAGRVREVAGVPSFAFAPAGSGQDTTGPQLLRGSGRSIPGINLRDLLYGIDRQHPGLLLRFGGHAMAAGVTLTPARLQPFRHAFSTAVNAALAGVLPTHVVESDGELSDAQLSIATARRIASLGPWGSAFPEPRFHGDFAVVHTRVLTDRFFRMALQRGDRLIEAVTNVPAPPRGSRIGAVYRLALNRYRGAEQLQLVVEQHWPA